MQSAVCSNILLCFQRCGCKTGFRLQPDGLTCNDVDECKEILPAACSHNCVNTLGSYLCQCHPEFILEPDGRSCKTAGINPFVCKANNHNFCMLLFIWNGPQKNANVGQKYNWNNCMCISTTGKYQKCAWTILRYNSFSFLSVLLY